MPVHAAIEVRIEDVLHLVAILEPGQHGFGWRNDGVNDPGLLAVPSTLREISRRIDL
jgi:hypothetical protein